MTDVISDDGADINEVDATAELEGMDASFDEETEETEVQEETQEPEETEETVKEEEAPEENDGEESEDKSEEESEEESKEEAEEETKEQEDVKAHNKKMAEQRIQAKQKKQSELKNQQEAYVSETKDPIEQTARRNKVELYNLKVEGMTNKLTNGYEKALKDFDILNDPTPEVQELVSEAIDTFQALNVPLDRYGNPIEVKADIYQYLQRKAESIERLTGLKAKVQEKAKSKEKSKTFTPPAKSPPKKKVDPDLAAFDEEAGF